MLPTFKATVALFISVVVMIAIDLSPPLRHRSHSDYGSSTMGTSSSRPPSSSMPNYSTPTLIYLVIPDHGNGTLPPVDRQPVITTWSTTDSSHHEDESPKPQYHRHSDNGDLPSLVGPHLREVAIFWQHHAPTRATSCRRRGDLWRHRHARLRAEDAAAKRHLVLHHAHDVIVGAWTALTMANMTAVVQQYSYALVSAWWAESHPMSAVVQCVCVGVSMNENDEKPRNPGNRQQPPSGLAMFCLLVLMSVFGDRLGGRQEPTNTGADNVESTPGPSAAQQQQPSTSTMPPPPPRQAANGPPSNRSTKTAISPETGSATTSRASTITEAIPISPRSSRRSRRSRQSTNRGSDRTPTTAATTPAPTPASTTVYEINCRMRNDRFQIKKTMTEMTTERPIVDVCTMAYLGSGKYASVYNVHSPLLRARIAVKVQYRTTDSTDEQYTREVAMTALASHPFCVHMSYAKMGSSLTVICLRLAGRPLEMILRDTRLKMYKKEETILIMARQVLLALNHLHRIVGVTHKDLHTFNILVDGEAVRWDPYRSIVRIADLGIAEPIKTGGGRTEDDRGNLRGESFDALQDVQEVGTIVFTAFFGRSPVTNPPDDELSPFYGVDQEKIADMSIEFRVFVENVLTREWGEQLSASNALNNPVFDDIIVGYVSDIQERATNLLTSYKQSDRMLERSIIYDVGDRLSTSLPAIVGNPRLQVVSADKYPKIYRGRGKSVGSEADDAPVQEVVQDMAENVERTVLEQLANWTAAMEARDESFANRIIRIITQRDEGRFSEHDKLQIESLLKKVLGAHFGTAPTTARTTTSTTTITSATTTSHTATTPPTSPTPSTSTTAPTATSPPTHTSPPTASTVSTATSPSTPTTPPPIATTPPTAPTTPPATATPTVPTPTTAELPHRPPTLQGNIQGVRLPMPLIQGQGQVAERQHSPSPRSGTRPNTQNHVEKRAPTARVLFDDSQLPSTSNAQRFDTINQHLVDQLKRAQAERSDCESELKKIKLDTTVERVRLEDKARALEQEVNQVHGHLDERDREIYRLRTVVGDGEDRFDDTRNQLLDCQGQLAQSQAALAEAQEQVAANNDAAIAANPRRFLNVIRATDWGANLVTLPVLRILAVQAGYNFPSRTKAPFVEHINDNPAGVNQN